MFEGGGGNQSVRSSEAACTTEAAGALRKGTIDGDFLERFQKTPHHLFLRVATCEQLAARNDAVEDPVTPGLDLSRPTEMVHEDVRIKQ